MVGLPHRLVGGLQPRDQFVVGRVVDLEGNVVEAADFRRFFRLRLAIDFVVGEREERQSPTIA
jgi:hypothetical protein